MTNGSSAFIREPMSVYTPEDLTLAMNSVRKRLDESNAQLDELIRDQSEKKEVSASVIPAYRQFRTWASEFEEASFKAKKMIANQIFTRVEVGKGYVMRYEMNVTYKQFCEEWMTKDN